MSVLISGGINAFSKQLAATLLDEGKKVIFLHNGKSDEQVPEVLLTNPNLKLVNLSSYLEHGIRGILMSDEVKTVYDTSLVTGCINLGPLAGAKKLLMGICSVLDACRAVKVIPAFILTSGEEVYGTAANRVETQPLEPTTFEGAAKMSVEAMIHSYAVSYRIPIVIGRIPKVLVAEKKDLELVAPGETPLSISDAARGVLSLVRLADVKKPAEVYNISTSFNEKIVATGLWSPSATLVLEDGPVELVTVPSVFLLYGENGKSMEQFVELSKLDGAKIVKSGITDFQAASDKQVEEEILTVGPTHLVYFSNENETFEGDCFTLRTNMATNLYFPWLLASISEKSEIHFTHFGAPTDGQETSAEAVKSYTGKMLEYFENTLRLGPNVDKNTLELMKARKTGALNNNV